MNYLQMRNMNSWKKLRSCMMLLLLSLTSCGTVARYLVFGEANPSPNMKTIHMMTVHKNYTQEMNNSHPDYDCYNTIKYDTISKRWESRNAGFQQN